MVHLLMILRSHMLRVHLLWLHVHWRGCSKLAVIMRLLRLLRRLLRLLRLVLLRLLLLLLTPLILLLLTLSSLSVNLFVSFLQRFLPLGTLHVFVLNRIYRRDPQL